MARWIMSITRALGVAVFCCGMASAATVTITEIPLAAASRPSAIVAGADGNLWFTEPGANRIGRINPATGVVTEFSAGLTQNAAPSGIALARDGSIWFTEQNADRIGRITPATGAIQEFAAGITPGSGPAAITLGPDDKLWFTEGDGARIGRIDPATGAITEFASGITAGSRPSGIAADGNGKLWFTETAAERIGRIDPVTGAVAEFPLASGVGCCAPVGIAKGPDNKLWFTESSSGRIGRIDPATGVIEEFSSGITAGSSPNQIAAGPDGNLWFTTIAGGRIGRVSPAGEISEFTDGITPGSALKGITAGPDGNLWFVSETAERLGKAVAQSAANTVQFSTSEYRVNELCFRAIVKVTRSGALDRSATVQFATSDGTAEADRDYRPNSGTLVFPPGSASQTFTVRIFDEGGNEGNETVNLSLLNPSGAQLGSLSVARITIFDSLRFDEGRGDECDDGDGHHGGGCAMAARGADATLLALPLLAAGYLGWRKAARRRMRGRSN
jgi:streptogramin lyase